MIDPQEVENVKFRTTRVREGYDQDEVDAFLDRVALTLRQALDSNGGLSAECSRLRARNQALQADLDAMSAAPTEVLPVYQPVLVQEPVQTSGAEASTRLLDMAQKTADDVLAQADIDARALVDQAERTAGNIIGAATTDADSRRAMAEEKARDAEEQLAAIAKVREDTRAYVDTVLSELRDRIKDGA